MSSSSRARVLLAAVAAGAVVAVAAVVVVVTGALGEEAPPHVFASVVYDPPEVAPDLRLTGHSGEPFSLEEFEGDVVVLYFGYTHCPDICPLTLNNLARARADLPEGLRGDLQVVMVSVDPARDTVDVLSNYVPRFDNDFIGVTGSPDEVDRVVADWRLFVELGERDADGNYLVGHPAFTLVIDRAGQRRLKMNHLMTIDQITADLRAVLEEA